MSNRYEATGTIKAIMATQDINDSFRKREFALEIQDGNYPQVVKFQAVQDRTELLDDYEVGDQVTVHFNLKGREYTRRSDGATDYWTNLEAWRLEKAEAGDGLNQDTGPAPEDVDQDPGIADGDVPF